MRRTDIMVATADVVQFEVVATLPMAGESMSMAAEGRSEQGSTDSDQAAVTGQPQAAPP